jgi:hypothetical protein
VVCPGISASLVKLAPSVLLDIPVSAGLLVLTVSQVTFVIASPTLQ